MRYSILIIAILSLFSCKKTEKIENVETSKVDSLQQIEMDVDSMIKVPEIVVPPKSYSQIKAELEAKGFETFDFINETTKDTVLMQKYFMAFLKNGSVRTQNEEEAQQLQEAHLDYLVKMYELGYADISGPFESTGDIRGITIYNVPTKKIADSLANADPMVKAGRLEIEIHPWWAAKGINLR